MASPADATDAVVAKPRTPRKKVAAAGPVAQADDQADQPAPARRTRARKVTPVSRLDELQQIIIASLEDDKAEDIVALDLVGRATFADRMLIATGLADRQISAMAGHLERKLHDAGVRRVKVEGSNGSDWVLIDAGDIIVHLFKQEARSLYRLEKMWGPDLDQASE